MKLIKSENVPVIITSGSTLSAAVEEVDCDDCVWSDSKGCGIDCGGNKCEEINGPAG